MGLCSIILFEGNLLKSLLPYSPHSTVGGGKNQCTNFSFVLLFWIMAGLWQRHPRYTMLVVVALITTFYLLVPASPPPAFHLRDSSLQSRLEHSNAIYSKVLTDRKGLIKKFGPQPKDIELLVIKYFSAQHLLTCHEGSPLIHHLGLHTQFVSSGNVG
jgi:hypothetical protein